MNTTPNGLATVRVRLISCLGVDLELPLLPHFLTHYAGLGIAPGDMHLILNTAREDAPALDEAKRALSKFGAAPPTLWIAPYTSDVMWEARRQLQREVARPGEWVMNADMDEHHIYPAPVPEIVRHCRAKGHNAVQGFLVDRVSEAGTLATVAPSPSLDRQFPREAEVDLTLMGRGEHHGLDGTVKLMLHAHDVLPSRGGHNPSAEGADARFLAGTRLARHPGVWDPAFRFGYPFRVDHYKWTATRQETFRTRLATPGVSAAGAEVGGKMIDYFSRHGSLRLEDIALRDPLAPRRDATWKRRMLAMRLGARAPGLRPLLDRALG